MCKLQIYVRLKKQIEEAKSTNTYAFPCEWMPPTQRLLWNNKVKKIIITHNPRASMWYPAVNLVESAELSQVTIGLAGSLPQTNVIQMYD